MIEFILGFIIFCIGVLVGWYSRKHHDIVVECPWCGTVIVHKVKHGNLDEE